MSAHVHRQGQRWARVSAAALAVAVIAGAVLALQPPPKRSLNLKDGSRATLEAVVYGSETEIAGSPLQRLLYAALPEAQKSRSGAVVYEGMNPAALSLWVRWRHPSEGVVGATIVDEAGHESAPADVNSLGGDLDCLQFSAFPRRGRIFKLRLYISRPPLPPPDYPGAWGWERLGETSFVNPAPPVQVAPWKAEPLPVTTAADDIKVILKNFEVGARLRGQPQRLHGPGEIPGQAVVQLTQNGKPALGWSPETDSVSDATGNTWRLPNVFVRESDTGRRLGFLTPPGPGDDVWKVRLRLRPDRTARFADDEVCRFPDVPIPPAGRSIALNRRQFIQGIPVELVEIHGPGARPSLRLEPGQAGLVVRVPGSERQDGKFEAPDARDDRGRSFNVFAIKGTNHPEVRAVYMIHPPSGTRSFDFNYALLRERSVEILVRPTRRD